MIAIGFVVILAVVLGIVSLTGAAPAAAAGASWGPLVVILLAFIVFFASGIYVGAALAALGLLLYAKGDLGGRSK